MPIALKSGKPVLKNTKLATTCSCCTTDPPPYPCYVLVDGSQVFWFSALLLNISWQGLSVPKGRIIEINLDQDPGVWDNPNSDTWHSVRITRSEFSELGFFIAADRFELYTQRSTPYWLGCTPNELGSIIYGKVQTTRLYHVPRLSYRLPYSGYLNWYDAVDLWQWQIQVDKSGVPGAVSISAISGTMTTYDEYKKTTTTTNGAGYMSQPSISVSFVP